MNSIIDLKAYFNRIGYKDKAKPGLETLKKLHLLHTQSIPFENFNPLLGIPVELDLTSIQNKIIHQKRGGYCFEHNLLFTEVLKAIGFNARPLAARVFSNRHESDITAKSHALVLIELNHKKYIADTGFGGQSLTAPLQLVKDITQPTPHENYRIIKREDYFILQVYLKGGWKTLYRFTLQKRYLIDFKVANWYTSTHPSSHFTYNLTVAIAKKGERHTLRNNIYRIHNNNTTVKEKLNSIEAIQKLLIEVFNLSLTHLPALDEKLTSLIEEN